MAKLSEAEKREFLRAKAPLREPAHRRLSVREYIEFATFASRFSRTTKPVNFTGKAWKL